MNIEQICSNSFNLIGVPIYIHYNSEKSVEFHNYSVPTRLQEIIDGNRAQLISKTKDNNICLLTDYSSLSYFSMKLNDEIFVIGPFLEKEVNTTTIMGLTGRLKLLNEDIRLVTSFYNSLRILNREEIEFLYNSFMNSINMKALNPSYTIVEAKEIKTSRKLALDNLFTELEYVRNNYNIEDRFVNVVKIGDIEGAKKFPTNEIMRQLPKRAINDSLRNAKTRLTILNTLCNRAAISGGIDVQLGHQISTNYGIMIESMNSIYQSDKLTKEIIVSYATAVNEYSLRNYSKLIKKAILSIRKNITYKYTITDLSEDLFVSKEHLSRAFKKETNMTVSEYIGYSKVNEAKKLLALSDYSISDVSDTLGFSNYSYFTKTFKKFTNLSPNQYRKVNKEHT